MTRPVRRVSWVAFLLFLLPSISLLQGGPRVAAESGTICPSTPFTSPGEFTCVLPGYVRSVTITAIGGHGGGGLLGGKADKVQATFPIEPGGFFSPGDPIYIEVGGNGSGGSGQAGGAGGVNGGGAGGNGGDPLASGGDPGLGGFGGGGASDVRRCSASAIACRPPLTAANDTRILVAAGGGGVGGGFDISGGDQGGDAGRPGADGFGLAAQPGTLNGGGEGGCTCGRNRTAQAGGDGGLGTGGTGGHFGEVTGGGGGGGG